MTQNRKPSRRPTASRYRSRATRYARPVSPVGGGQGGIMGQGSSVGLW
jgi:hypothetical protein